MAFDDKAKIEIPIELRGNLLTQMRTKVGREAAVQGQKIKSLVEIGSAGFHSYGEEVRQAGEKAKKSSGSFALAVGSLVAFAPGPVSMVAAMIGAGKAAADLAVKFSTTTQSMYHLANNAGLAVTDWNNYTQAIERSGKSSDESAETVKAMTDVLMQTRMWLSPEQSPLIVSLRQIGKYELANVIISKLSIGDTKGAMDAYVEDFSKEQRVGVKQKMAWAMNVQPSDLQAIKENTPRNVKILVSSLQGANRTMGVIKNIFLTLENLYTGFMDTFIATLLQSLFSNPQTRELRKNVLPKLAGLANPLGLAIGTTAIIGPAMVRAFRILLGMEPKEPQPSINDVGPVSNLYGPNALPNYPPTGRFTKGYAEGGIVGEQGPEDIVVGEEGPEIVIPIPDAERPWWETVYELVFNDPNFPGFVFERSLESVPGVPVRGKSIWDDPRSRSDWKLHPLYADFGKNISRYFERLSKKYMGRKNYKMMESAAQKYQPAAPDWGNAFSMVWVLKSMKLDDARGNPLRDALRKLLGIGPYSGAEETDVYSVAHDALNNQTVLINNKQLSEIREIIRRMNTSTPTGSEMAEAPHTGGGGEHAPPSEGTAGQAGLITTFAGRGVDVEHMDADLARRFQAAYEAAPPGQKFQLISGYRTYAQQVQAWHNLRGGRLGMVARPGTSRHEIGQAGDVRDPSGWLHRHAGQFGLQNLPGDYPHFQKSGSYGRRRRRVSMNVDLSGVQVADARPLKSVSIEGPRRFAAVGPFQIIPA